MQVSALKALHVNATDSPCWKSTCGISQIFRNVYATRPIRTIKPFSEMFLENAG